MKVTVLWEDKRGTELQGFGAGALVDACIRDRRNKAPGTPLPVNHLPKKGNGQVVAAMKGDFVRLGKLGPVLAVLDRDRIHAIWQTNPPSDCNLGITQRLAQDCASTGWRDRRHIVLLVDNIESLVDACQQARGRDILQKKPRPDERDQLISAVVWGDAAMRDRVLDLCPSFKRLVDLVDGLLP